jgi:hypothetical protein
VRERKARTLVRVDRARTSLAWRDECRCAFHLEGSFAGAYFYLCIARNAQTSGPSKRPAGVAAVDCGNAFCTGRRLPLRVPPHWLSCSGTFTSPHRYQRTNALPAKVSKPVSSGKLRGRVFHREVAESTRSACGFGSPGPRATSSSTWQRAKRSTLGNTIAPKMRRLQGKNGARKRESEKLELGLSVGYFGTLLADTGIRKSPRPRRSNVLVAFAGAHPQAPQVPANGSRSVVRCGIRWAVRLFT